METGRFRCKGFVNFSSVEVRLEKMMFFEKEVSWVIIGKMVMYKRNQMLTVCLGTGGQISGSAQLITHSDLLPKRAS